MGGSGGAARDPALDPVEDAGEPEQVEGHVEIDVGNAAAPGAPAVIRDILRFGRDVQRGEIRFARASGIRYIIRW
jgi:hypothetical protein